MDTLNKYINRTLISFTKSSYIIYYYYHFSFDAHFFFLRYIRTRIKCMIVVPSNDDNIVLPFSAETARSAKICLLTLIGSDIKHTFRLDVLLNHCFVFV